MSDLTKVFGHLRSEVTAKHRKYLEVYGREVTMAIAHNSLIAERSQAKLSLIAKMFQDAKVITGYRTIGASTADGEYPNSIEMFFRPSPKSIYLMIENGGVIVTDAVAKVSVDKLSKLILALSDDRKVFKKFPDILSLAFDWEAFVAFVLESIHRVIYDQQQVVKEHFLSFLMDDKGDGDDQDGQ